ncbi:hypothetical protein QU24_24375, partial [Pantoea rodasii]
MLLAKEDELFGDIRRDFFWLRETGTGAIFNRGELFSIKTLKPFITGFSTNAVKVAKLGHGFIACLAGEDEVKALHGNSLSPGHSESPLLCQFITVTHVPGLKCYPCARFAPLCA